MFEWLQSPIAYRDIHGFRNTFQKLMADYFNSRSTINHYLGLTRRTFLDFGESTEVKAERNTSITATADGSQLDS